MNNSDLKFLKYLLECKDKLNRRKSIWLTIVDEHNPKKGRYDYYPGFSGYLLNRMNKDGVLRNVWHDIDLLKEVLETGGYISMLVVAPGVDLTQYDFLEGEMESKGTFYKCTNKEKGTYLVFRRGILHWYKEDPRTLEVNGGIVKSSQYSIPEVKELIDEKIVSILS